MYRENLINKMRNIDDSEDFPRNNKDNAQGQANEHFDALNSPDKDGIELIED